MSSVNLYELVTENYINDTVQDVLYMPTPGIEPTIGVIDTLFDKRVYFNEWVEYHEMVDEAIPKQQTDYKIKYVSEYIRLWAIISAERVDVKDINFIDCMCNAGIYMDGDCCTAMEVLNIFIEIANKHKNKNFNLYII